MSLAFLDAALSDRLVMIAEETLAQAERTFEQTRQQREAGRMAEFDLLRAQVARDTQRPEVIRRRNARDIAYLRLKQLLDLPLDAPIQIATRFEDDVLPAPAQRFANAIAEAESGTALRERVAIAQATNDVRSREQDVRIARAQRLPAISVNSTYTRIAYPTRRRRRGTTSAPTGTSASASRFRCSPDGGSRRTRSSRARPSRSSRRGCS